jgi:hypothetical protein
MNAICRASRREPVSSPELTRPGSPGGSPVGSQLRSARRASARVDPAHVSGPSSGRPRVATTLFEVPFASAMSGLDLALLERTLDLSIRMHAKMHPRPDSPAFVRLDHYSGLLYAALDGWRREMVERGSELLQSASSWRTR